MSDLLHLRVFDLPPHDPILCGVKDVNARWVSVYRATCGNAGDHDWDGLAICAVCAVRTRVPVGLVK